MPERVVFRPILPRNPNYFEDAATTLIGELAATMMGPVARTLIQAEEQYIDNWKHKPKIISEFVHQKTQLKLTVKPSGTNKKYWAFVSLGTTGKVYGPKSAQFMSVRLDYVPKTAPGGVFNGPGSYSGNVVFSQAVDWPGIKPRKFEEKIVDKFGDNIILLLGYAFEKALRRLG